MPKRRTEQKSARPYEKDCWHTYSLQVLSPAKFSQVVGKILKGHYLLLTARMQQRDQQGLQI